MPFEHFTHSSLSSAVIEGVDVAENWEILIAADHCYLHSFFSLLTLIGSQHWKSHRTSVSFCWTGVFVGLELWGKGMEIYYFENLHSDSGVLWLQVGFIPTRDHLEPPFSRFEKQQFIANLYRRHIETFCVVIFSERPQPLMSSKQSEVKSSTLPAKLRYTHMKFGRLQCDFHVSFATKKSDRLNGPILLKLYTVKTLNCDFTHSNLPLNLYLFWKIYIYIYLHVYIELVFIHTYSQNWNCQSSRTLM